MKKDLNKLSFAELQKNKIENERAKEFIECLGNGKTIYQIEMDEELSL